VRQEIEKENRERFPKLLVKESGIRREMPDLRHEKEQDSNQARG
jgi:hypothetical protein